MLSSSNCGDVSVYSSECILLQFQLKNFELFLFKFFPVKLGKGRPSGRRTVIYWQVKFVLNGKAGPEISLLVMKPIYSTVKSCKF